ncbi:MAG: twin-arginine translocation signal domain-containing protein, partial [Deltaproteobacteria bacterium]|nr:twin-arginine translocation signal domain-containing protein [Deltaproteobacteria bacterium]
MKKQSVVTRRDFLRGTAGLVMAMGLGGPALETVGAEDRTRVILIRHPEVMGPAGRVNGTILQQMLDEAVRML